MTTKRLLNAFSLSCMLTCACMSQTLLAAETEVAEQQQSAVEALSNRFAISRPMAAAKKAALQKARAIDAKKARKLAPKGVTPSSLIAKGGYPLEVNKHYVQDASTKGKAVEIENGAIFSVRELDCAIVAKWLKATPISIIPNSSSWPLLKRLLFFHYYAHTLSMESLFPLRSFRSQCLFLPEA